MGAGKKLAKGGIVNICKSVSNKIKGKNEENSHIETEVDIEKLAQTLRCRDSY